MKRILTSTAVLAIVAATVLISLLWPRQAKSEAEPGPTALELQEQHASDVADAIEYAEGKCAPGASGEQGCYQYLPSTWRAYSTIVAGKVLPQTKENERMVTVAMILSWIQDGTSDRGIFLLWNQGSATGWGPGSKDCYAGVNKWGVPYDSCAYAEKALQYLAEGGSNVPGGEAQMSRPREEQVFLRV